MKTYFTLFSNKNWDIEIDFKKWVVGINCECKDVYELLIGCLSVTYFRSIK